MGRTIELKESTFERIVKSDTNYQGANAIINRALDALESASTSTHRRKHSNSREKLLFAEIITANIGGQELLRPSWRLVVIQLLKDIKGKYSMEELYTKFGIRATEGVYQDGGYQYEEELGYSLGGFAAGAAGKIIELLAKEIGVSVDIHYRWNHRSERSGEENHLRINPEKHVPHLVGKTNEENNKRKTYMVDGVSMSIGKISQVTGLSYEQVQRHLQHHTEPYSIKDFKKSKSRSCIYCVINGVRYDSVTEASRQIGMSTRELEKRFASKNYPSYLKFHKHKSIS